MAIGVKKSIGGTASATAVARKVKRLNQLIDQLVQECGPMFPGFAAVVLGARKLLHQVPPEGKQRRTFRTV